MVVYNKGGFVGAFNIWKPMVDEGNALAQLLITLMFDRGESVAKNHHLAFDFF